jgi:hypothetical protein
MIDRLLVPSAEAERRRNGRYIIRYLSLRNPHRFRCGAVTLVFLRKTQRELLRKVERSANNADSCNNSNEDKLTLREAWKETEKPFLPTRKNILSVLYVLRVVVSDVRAMFCETPIPVLL